MQHACWGVLADASVGSLAATACLTDVCDIAVRCPCTELGGECHFCGLIECTLRKMTCQKSVR